MTRASSTTWPAPPTSTSCPTDTEPQIRAILDDCLAGEGSGDSTDTTDTTVAGDATTTTTAAG